MKKHAIALMLLLGYTIIATSIVGAQSQSSSFIIEVKAAGTVELICTEGCNFEELIWTCSDTNQKKQCTVAVDASGMLHQ